MSVGGLVLYFSNKENTALTLTLCAVSFLLCTLKIFFVYPLEGNPAKRAVTAVALSAFIALIFFIVGILFSAFSLKQVFLLETVVITFMLLPSFLLVFGIIALILEGM